MLSISNLSKTFNKKTEYEVSVFKAFNLEIGKGECVAILGSNGCGKSTLLNLINGVIEADEGEIKLGEKIIAQLKPNELAHDIAKVHQNPADGTVPSLSILENLSIADKKGERFRTTKLIRKNKKNEFRKILQKLELGLEDKLDTQVKYLSGGQRQALALIMATLKTPKLLLLDEHTAALDPKTSRLIMEKTSEITKVKGITTLMISHNLEDAINYSDRVIMLNKGKVILDKRSNEVTEEELIRLYSKLAKGR